MMAGAYGNRTHQEPVSKPLTGFEDRAGHQPRTHSRVLSHKGWRREYRSKCVGPTGYFTGFVPQIGGTGDGTARKVEAER